MPNHKKPLGPDAKHYRRAQVLREFLDTNALSFVKLQNTYRHSDAAKWLEKAVHGQAVPPDEWLREALVGKGSPASWLRFWRDWTLLDIEEVTSVLIKTATLPRPAADLVAISAYNIDHVLTTSGLRERKIEVSQDQSQAEQGRDQIVPDLSAFERLLKAQRTQLGIRVGGSALNTARLLDEADRYSIRVLCAVGSTIRDKPVSEPDATFTVRLLANSRRADSLAVDRRPREAGQCLVEPVRRDDDKWARRLNTYTGANATLAEHIYANFYSLVADLSAAKIVHVSSFYDRETAEAIANLVSAVSIRSPQTTISFDPGTHWTEQGNAFTDIVDQILPTTSLMFLNHGEFRSLVDGHLGLGHEDDTRAAQALLGELRPGAAVVVIKLEGRTRIYREHDREPREFKVIAAKDEDIEDDTGAGDVFAAGFLAARIDDRLSEEDGAIIGMQLARTKILSDHLPSGTLLRDLIEAAAAGASAAA